MDLLKIDTPEFVSGMSFAPLLKDSSARVRESALTELIIYNNKTQGYSIKTDRYRLTQWGENGYLGYELYDHKFDKVELNNLAENKAYENIKDSLKTIIKHRISEARKKPLGLGKQIENANAWGEPKEIHSRPKK